VQHQIVTARDDHERVELDVFARRHRRRRAALTAPAPPRPQALFAQNEPTRRSCVYLNRTIHHDGTTMSQTVFFEFQFVALVASSIVAPAVIFGIMLWKRAMSRATVLAFGIALIVLSCVDVALLEMLDSAAKLTPPLIDDRMFSSEVSIALFVLPAVLAGVGTNVVSQLLVSHLEKIEKQFDREHPDAAGPRMETRTVSDL
jgi:hypothetical protein